MEQLTAGHRVESKKSFLPETGELCQLSHVEMPVSFNKIIEKLLYVFILLLLNN
jgi:hypothetical protein